MREFEGVEGERGIDGIQLQAKDRAGEYLLRKLDISITGKKAMMKKLAFFTRMAFFWTLIVYCIVMIARNWE